MKVKVTLGKMATRKRKQAGIVRCFEVSEPTLHQKGHTIYKVTQRVIKVDCPEEDVQEVIVWRRYNDFKKLYKAMVKLHLALQRKEEFPPFVEAKVFGRFEEEVIKRRMLSGQDLLNFVGQKNYLVASRAFQQFFEGSEMRKYEGIPPLLSSSMILQPDDLEDLQALDLQAQDLQVVDRPCPEGEDGSLLYVPDGVGGNNGADGKDNFPRVPSYNQLLGGVWRYRQIAEEISLGGDDEDDTDFTDDSALSTPLPDSELAFFDPLKSLDEAENSRDKGNYSNEWLLSQDCAGATSSEWMRNQQEPSEEQDEDQELKMLGEEFAACGLPSDSNECSPLTSRTDLTESVDNLTGAGETLTSVDSKDTLNTEFSVDSVGSSSSAVSGGKPRSGSVVESGKGDLVMSPVHKQAPADFNRPLHSLTSTPTASPLHRPLHSLTSTPSASPQHVSKGSPARSPLRQNLISLDMKEKADYIFLAANQISLAQQCEANNNYHMAFSYYKSAVGIMLTGVQKDDNKTRREVVRKKTAKYLLKAEELYHLYLDSREKNYHGERWDTGKPSPAKELDPNVAFLQGSISELRSFRVIGVIDKALLVIDTLSDQTFVIKVLQKSCLTLEHRNIVPIHLPYMVQLHKFYETESAIYCLLQHASGGKLWNYVSGYLQQQQQYGENELDNILHDPHEKRLRTRSDTNDSDRTVTSGSNKALDSKSFVNVPINACDKGGVELKTNGVKYTKEGVVDSCLDNSIQYPAGPNSTSTELKSNTEIPTQGMSSRTSFQDNEITSELFYLGSNMYSTAIDDRTLGTSKHSARPRSLSSERNYSENDSNTFEDVLQNSRTKPQLEQFSINSFDSDSGPGSRYESQISGDYIESIPELCEANAGESSEKDDPLNGILGNRSSLHRERIDSHDILKSALDTVEYASHELKTDPLPEGLFNQKPTITDFSDLELKTRGSSPGKTLAPFSCPEEDDEPSIYDKFKSPEADSTSVSDNDISSKPISDKEIPNIAGPSVQDQQSKVRSLSPTSPSSDSDRIQVFHLPSQERSAGTPSKHKKRHRPSLFGSFGLDDEKIKNGVMIPEGCVKQWGAEILTALSSLHNMGYICRDLRPSNVLLGERGHILLTYLSQWNVVERDYDVEAQTALYSAPEVGGVSPVTPSCDLWSFGALLYELLTGKTLSLNHPSGITSHTQILVPDHLSSEAQALLKDLLKYNPEERLGAGASGVDEIKLHPFFSDIEWSTLLG